MNILKDTLCISFYLLVVTIYVLATNDDPESLSIHIGYISLYINLMVLMASVFMLSLADGIIDSTSIWYTLAITLTTVLVLFTFNL